MQLRQYQEGHINWFYTKNKSLTMAAILDFENFDDT